MLTGRPPIDGGVVVITGASAGIGAAFARELAARARVLVLVARRRERLEALAAELPSGATIEVRPADLTDVAAVDALAEALLQDHGCVDVLINNAGMGDVGLLEAADPDKITRLLQVNMVGLTRLTQRLLPAMVERKRGGVLMVSSGYGLVWMPGLTAYVASKHYVTALSDALRCELVGTGVVVSQLCPGPVATEFEQVAEAPRGFAVPGFVQLSAQSCARLGLRGFDRGWAVIVPGIGHNLLIQSYRLLPRPLMRLMGMVMGAGMRRLAGSR